MTDYTHPRVKGDIAACDGLRDHALLAREAAAALARRQSSYPELVKAGKLEQSTADADIAAWASIAADWAWIASAYTDHPEPVEGHGEGEQNSGRLTDLRARIAALDTAIDRFFTALDRRGGSSVLVHAEAEQITALIAMRWHAERERNPEAWPIKARMAASINHQLRAQRQQSNTVRPEPVEGSDRTAILEKAA